MNKVPSALDFWTAALFDSADDSYYHVTHPMETDGFGEDQTGWIYDEEDKAYPEELEKHAVHRARLNALIAYAISLFFSLGLSNQSMCAPNNSLLGGGTIRAARRSRLSRRHAAEVQWKESLPFMIDEFLRWTHTRFPSMSHPTRNSSASEDTVGADSGLEGPDHATMDSESNAARSVFFGWPISILNLRCALHACCMEDVNLALMRHGLIAGTPVRPHLAFDLDLIEFAYHLWRNSPGTGLQGIVKSAYAFSLTPYKNDLDVLFSNAFDIYNEITRKIHKKVDGLLGHNAPDWQMKYGCPPCGFELPDDEHFDHDRMHAMDGCDSQKRDQYAGRVDDCVFEGGPFVPRDFIEKYAHEVRSGRPALSEPGDLRMDLGSGPPSPSQPVVLENGFIVREDVSLPSALQAIS
ncbi:hypothetical protein K488DRAFT_73770 [Vararia minispora EC-137]|uniref:Uncharacterized protein n=1 Tax=Vararia minispora EC-137 TaxID=1314806 RepID=A0ACB8QAZ2_9AGAM|nr:hypothetical protein K488DRAFT_73770 [Vararia minispora EC-137]